MTLARFRFLAVPFPLSCAILASAVFAVAAPSEALAESDVSFGWRPTARRAYVFAGSKDSQFDLPDLIANAAVKDGTKNSHAETLRFEGEVNSALGAGFEAGARMSGGRFRLHLTDDSPTRVGQDYTWDLHARLKNNFSNGTSVAFVAGARVRKWWFPGGDIPAHGNVGILLGVKPAWGPVSLLVESTLAAVWLGELTRWGAQKDSSVLRIRPEFETPPLAGGVSYILAGEYYHTHTEWFGSKLEAGENAIMLDDFELSAIAGVRFRF